MRGKPSVFSRVLKAIVGAGTVPTMPQPYGMAVGPDGRLYVADSSAGRIHVFGLAKADYRSLQVESESLIGIAFIGTRMVVTRPGGRPCCASINAARRCGPSGARTGFSGQPEWWRRAICVFVVDTLGHRIVGVTPAGAVVTSFGRRGVGPGQMNYPTHIAMDAARRQRDRRDELPRAGVRRQRPPREHLRATGDGRVTSTSPGHCR
jgi:hypothetical protein